MAEDITNGITDEQRAAIIKQYHQEGGKKGGATMKKRGPEYFREIGRKGAISRWGNKEEA